LQLEDVYLAHLTRFM